MSEEYTLEDYREAPGGIGPLASEWKDKPHRLIYDLTNMVKARDEKINSLIEHLARQDRLIAKLTVPIED